MIAQAAYSVDIRQSAKKELDRLSSDLRSRIAEKILELESTPRPKGCVKLSVSSKYRIRVGDYRILYEIDDRSKRVEIVSVAHRREAYR